MYVITFCGYVCKHYPTFSSVLRAEDYIAEIFEDYEEENGLSPREAMSYYERYRRLYDVLAI